MNDITLAPVQTELQKPNVITLAPVQTEANSLNSAMTLLVLKLKLKNHGRHVPHSMLLDPFKFVDIDEKGVLTPEGLHDMFSGMGINICPEVLDEALAWTPNQDGTLEYSKFVDTVYPRLVPDLLKEYRSRHTGVVDHPLSIKTGY
eukprot:gene16125-22269_t